MKKLIMIKYGELTIKKDNKNFFIRTLVKNIEEKLKGIEYNITYDFFRMFIETEEFDKVKSILKDVFGIFEIVECYMVEDKSIESIGATSVLLMSRLEFNTFKVVTNRSDKSYEIKSMEVSRVVGGYILKNLAKKKVDVHSPDVELNIEIRKEGVYLFTPGIKGLGGYPVGTLGKALLMLSGGIDSPVAGYLTMKKGVKLDYIYFESIPHTSIEARNKVISLANIIRKYGAHSKLYIVNFTKIQEAIYQSGREDYLVTIMRRMMYRISEEVAKRNKCHAIVTGESVGQVASQTLTSMKTINEVTNFPILRPLCSFDKLEIIDISKRIGAYETSILPYEDCCTVFVPKHPVINPNVLEARKIEDSFDWKSLVDEAINSIDIVEIKETDEKNIYL